MICVKVYGFGSYFAANKPADDVDLLLLFEDSAVNSVKCAIRCKNLLKAAVMNADIVMLSTQEERELGFLNRSGAVFLGIVYAPEMSKQVARLAAAILNIK